MQSQPCHELGRDIVRVDKFVWERLLTSASGLSSPVQATLDKLKIFMSADGGRAHPGRENLSLCRGGLSLSTISQHLAAAEQAGWIYCVERGGYRPGDRGPRASVYVATVPVDVWERRDEILNSAPWRSAPRLNTVDAAEQTDDTPEPRENPTLSGDTCQPEPRDLPAEPRDLPAEPRDLPAEPRVDPNPIRPSASGLVHQSSDGVAAEPTTTDDDDLVTDAAAAALRATTGRTVTDEWARRVAESILEGRDVRTRPAWVQARYVRRAITNAHAEGTVQRFLPTPTPPSLRRDDIDDLLESPPPPPMETAPCGHQRVIGDTEPCWLCDQAANAAPWDRPDLQLISGSGGPQEPPRRGRRGDPMPGQAPLLAVIPGTSLPDAKRALSRGPSYQAAVAAARAAAEAARRQRLTDLGIPVEGVS